MPYDATLPKFVAGAVGLVAIACAALGLLYNVLTLATALYGRFDGLVQEHSIPHFYVAFYSMSAICVLSYLALCWCGIQFLRHRPPPARALAAVILFEVSYLWSISLISGHLPSIGLGVGAAMGVSNGGMMIQAMALLPVWGPPAAFWLARRAGAPSAA